MPRYIEEKELKDWVENWLYKDRYYHNGRVSKNIPIPELYDILEQMPTADVFPVVRCKECKHHGDDHFCCYSWCTNPEEFCSRGERRNDENIDIP